jgi:hypothetical protein
VLRWACHGWLTDEEICAKQTGVGEVHWIENYYTCKNLLNRQEQATGDAFFSLVVLVVSLRQTWFLATAIPLFLLSGLKNIGGAISELSKKSLKILFYGSDTKGSRLPECSTDSEESHE